MSLSPRKFNLLSTNLKTSPANSPVSKQVAAKYIFVRILRDSRHLQSNTFIHWSTWLSCTFGLAAISFVIAEAVPIFDYLLSLAGSICAAPLALALPAWLWLYDHMHWRTGSAAKQIAFWLHVMLIALGAFVSVGGTYGVAVQIKEAYASGEIGEFCLLHRVVITGFADCWQVRCFLALITLILRRWWNDGHAGSCDWVAL